jgi:hypothetical protein
VTRFTLTNSTANVACEADLPDGFTASERFRTGLAYPFDLGGVCNVPVSMEPDPDESGFPRIDLLPARGLLFWVVSYDERVEEDADARPPRDGVDVRDVPRFRDSDAAAPRWDNVLMWSKLVALGPHKTCQLFAFAGTSPLAPVDRLGPLLDSLALSG